MDPLTALSVASNVVQFVEFAFKVLSEASQLYRDEELSVHEQSRRVTNDLKDFSEHLQKSIRNNNISHNTIANEEELEKLCLECVSLSNDLIAKLENLKSPGKGHPWKSVGRALKSMWSKSELVAIEARLSNYRDAVNSRLLGSLRNRVDQILKGQSIQTLEINSHMERLVASALFEFHAALAKSFEEQTQLLAKASFQKQTRRVPEASDQSGARKVERPAHLAETKQEAQAFSKIQYDEAQLHKKIAEKITKSLKYEGFDQRYETVNRAHTKTFEWIFQPRREDDEVQWSDFTKWLEEGDDLYWISGKPGSGKTALMKFIYENPATEEHLRLWAKDQPLYVAGFFFWWAGTKKQQSQEGLLRTLLYSLLKQIPSLVPYVFPLQSAKLYDSLTGIEAVKHTDVHEHWDLEILMKGFRRLISQVEIPTKICLFIDGLDEYDGRATDIAELFKDVVISSQVKVCVSSRPLVALESAFKSKAKIRIQDLTRRDIETYVTDRLVHDPMMETLSSQEPVACSSLVTEIGDAASGVFLWVELVVKSLLDGLSNQDRIEDLMKRLKEIPRGLEPFYEHIVMNIDSIYQEEASRLYQLVEVAREQLNDWSRLRRLSLISLYLAMHEESLSDSGFITQLQDRTTVLNTCKEMDNFLRTHCGGLLEVQYLQGNNEIIPSMSVLYLHRTVREYLPSGKTS